MSSHKNVRSIRYIDKLNSLDLACRFTRICIHCNYTHEYRKIGSAEMQLHAVLFRWCVSQRDERRWRSHGWPKFACMNVWANWELAVLVEKRWNGKLSENGDNRDELLSENDLPGKQEVVWDTKGFCVSFVRLLDIKWFSGRVLVSCAIKMYGIMHQLSRT